MSRHYIIVRADRTARIVNRYPRLRDDEVAYPLTITWPDGWGRISTPGLVITLPEQAPSAITLGEIPIQPTIESEQET